VIADAESVSGESSISKEDLIILFTRIEFRGRGGAAADAFQARGPGIFFGGQSCGLN